MEKQLEQYLLKKKINRLKYLQWKVENIPNKGVDKITIKGLSDRPKINWFVSNRFNAHGACKRMNNK